MIGLDHASHAARIAAIAPAMLQQQPECRRIGACCKCKPSSCHASWIYPSKALANATNNGADYHFPKALASSHAGTHDFS